MHPTVSPDGVARGVRGARRPVGRVRGGRRGSAGAADQRRLRRDAPGVVAGRQRARVLVRPRRRDGRVGARHADRPRSARSPAADSRRRGRQTARASPISIRRRSCASSTSKSLEGAEGARAADGTRPPELVARRTLGRDVGAPPLFDALPRGDQPGTLGAGRAQPVGHRPRRVRPGQVVRSAAAQVDRHAREPRPGVVAGRRGRWRPSSTAISPPIPVARDGTPTGPPRRLSSDMASSPSWTGDSRRILYQALDRFRLVDSADGSVRDIDPAPHVGSAKQTTGALTVHAGRLFDGRGADARAGVDIVIEGNRIRQVEPHRDDLHRGTVVDASSGHGDPGHHREPYPSLEGVRPGARDASGCRSASRPCAIRQPTRSRPTRSGRRSPPASGSGRGW